MTNILDKIIAGKLRWFGHVMKRQITKHVRSVENTNIEIEGRVGVDPN